VNAILDDYDLPNMATVFRRRFKKSPDSHSAVPRVRGEPGSAGIIQHLAGPARQEGSASMAANQSAG
jgi:hypothetical protein